MDYRDKGQLTVEELIEKLKQLPPKELVWTEGCDCWGAAHDVVIQTSGEILITRCN